MNHTRTATVITLAAAGLLLAGCSSSQPVADGRPATAAQRPANSSPVDAGSAFKAIAAKVSFAKFGSTVTADTDSNHLLGRPGQYTSKVDFTDSRVKPGNTQGFKPGDVERGGSIETFAGAGDAATRAKYIQTVTKSIPALAEYDYVHGASVIRVSRFLTPTQAKDYDTADAKLG
ncbi:hypothetical protein AB0451_36420 [Streptomyces sp. NPDC052000]|uniref:hypothetical protein n=1 Tax=Streptomyces sp. NPDC052000 TaxID=3155676 RepID=UPI00344E7E05